MACLNKVLRFIPVLALLLLQCQGNKDKTASLILKDYYGIEVIHFRASFHYWIDYWHQTPHNRSKKLTAKIVIQKGANNQDYQVGSWYNDTYMKLHCNWHDDDFRAVFTIQKSKDGLSYGLTSAHLNYTLINDFFPNTNDQNATNSTTFVPDAFSIKPSISGYGYSFFHEEMITIVNKDVPTRASLFLQKINVTICKLKDRVCEQVPTTTSGPTTLAPKPSGSGLTTTAIALFTCAAILLVAVVIIGVLVFMKVRSNGFRIFRDETE